MGSEDRFGYEWGRYSDIFPEYEKQFLNWIKPLGTNGFEGKDILDAGCGMGRNSYYALLYGAKFVTAFDADKRSVQVARKNLSDFPNTEILLMDIYDLDYKDRFDLIITIGVIHHLENPKLALSKLIRALKPDGEILFWVYSFEGNEWIKKYISPIREKFLSKLPISYLHSITYLISIPFYFYIRIFPETNSYIAQISRFSFTHVHTIVFDQLLPKVANYWTKDQVYSLVENLGLSNVSVESPQNKMGWILIGKK